MWKQLEAWCRGHAVATICISGVLAVAVFVGVFVEAPWWMDATRLHLLGAVDTAAQHNALDEDRSQILKNSCWAGRFDRVDLHGSQA
jgi:hypothetical protein